MITSIIKLAVILVPLLLEWLLNRNTHEPDTYQTKIKHFNAVLADRNAAGLSIAFDRMRIPTGGKTGAGSDHLGPGSETPGERELRSDTGLASGTL